MMKLTVICREDGFDSNILIYTVDVRDPDDHDEVQREVQEAREADLDGEEAGEMEILFAFQGDIQTRVDWRQ
jgi:hypothetical protein